MSNEPGRIASLDQFRGYTVLGMFVVNFVGGLDDVHPLLKHHHTYCSYADTIMPQFLLAVGFGYRLSFLRRQERDGMWAAVRHAIGRNLGLILLGIVIYHLTGGFRKWDDLLATDPGEFALKLFKRGPFETLTHIGVTSLWVLPVIAARGWVRVLFAVASAALHVWVSKLGYYEWNLAEPKGIDGGPLGFLSWTVPLIVGTLAHDWMIAEPRQTRLMLLVSVMLMALGIGLSLQPEGRSPPFVPLHKDWDPTYWVMSLRAASVSYVTFAAGFGLAVYAVFRWACDIRRWTWSYLDLLGRHALTAYILHDLVGQAVKPFVPKDAPWWYVALACMLYLAIVTLFLRHLDRHKLVLKL
jgi:predicted acyltransferase